MRCIPPVNRKALNVCGHVVSSLRQKCKHVKHLRFEHYGSLSKIHLSRHNALTKASCGGKIGQILSFLREKPATFRAAHTRAKFRPELATRLVWNDEAVTHRLPPSPHDCIASSGRIVARAEDEEYYVSDLKRAQLLRIHYVPFVPRVGCDSTCHSRIFSNI